MAKKQFKIGEYAIGGRVQVEIKKTYLIIKCLDWDTKEEVRINHVSIDNYHELQNILNDITSSYYADKITEWVESKVSRKEMSW